MSFAVPELPMRVLQARFHSNSKDCGSFVVVGHVVWESDRSWPVVQPSTELLMRDEPATLLSKLQYLVAVNGQESFHRLQILRSQFWSFVEVNLVSSSGGST